MFADKQIVGYIRVSTGRQATHGKGIDEQRKAVEFHARGELGVQPHHPLPSKLVQIFVEEPWSGADGTADERPQLQAAIAAACKHGSKAVFIVRDMARLTRGPQDAESICRQLEEAGVELLCLNNWKFTARFGKVLGLQYVTHIAQQQHQRLKQIAKDAVKNAARSGKHWGRIPYGFVKDDAGKLERHPDEYEVLQRIGEDIHNGFTAYAIAKSLNAEQIRTQSGGTWSPNQVKNAHNRYEWYGPDFAAPGDDESDEWDDE